ncbi:MAG: hypothetical protein DRJ67_04215 [Thermoprotei archaeon]|nr:MAG: hypothetical protein DRJ67_04215 [Thermoprotei archaeon]
MRRGRKYKCAIVTGALLTAAGLLLSLWTMYYASPRMVCSKHLALHVEESAAVHLPLRDVTGEKVYYLVNITSTAPLELSLSFLSNGTEVGSAYLGSHKAHVEKGSLTLLSVPEEVLIILNCSSCEVRGSVTIRYSSIDVDRLMLLNILLTAASLGGVALLLYGAYNYALLRYSPPRKLELERE